MIRGLIGFVLSLGIHAVAGALLFALLRPDTVPEQNSAISEVRMRVIEVGNRDATAVRPDSTELASQSVDAAEIMGQGVPLRSGRRIMWRPAGNFKPTEVMSEPAPAPRNQEIRIETSTPAQTDIKPHTPPTSVASTGGPPLSAVEAERPNGDAAVRREPQSEAARIVAQVGGTLAISMTPNSHLLVDKDRKEIRSSSVPVEPKVAQEFAAISDGLRSSKAFSLQLPPDFVTAETARPGPVPSQDLAEGRPELLRINASFDWSARGRYWLDSEGLDTLQAFLRPGSGSGDRVRDGLSAALEATECARVHTAFDPETGSIDLRGHIPTREAAVPLLVSLREEIGESMPVTESLRVLPSPQCDLLDGMAMVGLPSSEEQFTDPMLVGESSFVREYAFTEGERLVIDLIAPDYPAYVYVDFFDATGDVLHLTPNERVPLRFYRPGEAFSIGRSGGLDLRIAPPFGQDIAIAYATNVPLYTELRPIREQAGDYLAWLEERVSEMQEMGGFRGEWVYIFISTAAGSVAD